MGAGVGEARQEPRVAPPVLPRVQRGHVGGARVHHQLVARVAGPGAALAPAHHAVHLAAHRHLHHAPQLVLGSAVKRSIGLTITEKAPTRAFSWFKAATTAFTFKKLLRHYAKWTLTPAHGK